MQYSIHKIFQNVQLYLCGRTGCNLYIQILIVTFVYCTLQVATGMVAGTFLAAPLMFVSARMLSVVVVSEMDYKDLLLKTSFDASIISMVACVSICHINWRQKVWLCGLVYAVSGLNYQCFCGVQIMTPFPINIWPQFLSFEPMIFQKYHNKI